MSPADPSKAGLQKKMDAELRKLRGALQAIDPDQLDPAAQEMYRAIVATVEELEGKVRKAFWP